LVRLSSLKPIIQLLLTNVVVSKTGSITFQTQASTSLFEFERGVGYYYPTLEIVGVSNGFIIIKPWAILIS
jgi:hypothetical protein